MLHTERHLQAVSTAEYVQGLCEKMPPLPDIPRGQAPWHVVLTRADFEACNDTSRMNHWIPAWPASADVLAAEQKSLEQDAKRRRYELLQRLSEAEEDAVTASIMEELELQRLERRNFKQLVSRLHASTGLLTREVGREGNCGIWAFLGLRAGNPWMSRTSDEHTHLEMMDARAMLADLWREVASHVRSDDPIQGTAARLWAQHFFFLVPRASEEDAGDAERTDAGDVPNSGGQAQVQLRNVKQEPTDPTAPSSPKTPPASRHDAVYAQHTPPKLTATAKRSMGAGILAARPDSGPSIPLQATVSSCKTEMIVKAEPEDNGGHDVPGRSTKQPLKRARKESTEARDLRRLADKKLQAARVHLASLQVAANSWSRVHARGQVLKGAMSCANGGWKRLVEQLVDGSVPDACKLCSELLSVAKFSMDALQRAVRQATDDTPHALQDTSEQQSQQTKKEPGEKIVKQEPGEVSVKQEVQEASDAEDGAAPSAGVQACRRGKADFDVRDLVRQNPHLQLLPENTHKRRHPVQCNICIRASSKQPAVFDLIDIRKEKFYLQHVNAPTHVRNLAVRKGGQAPRAAGGSGAARGGAGCPSMQTENPDAEVPPAVDCHGLRLTKALPASKIVQMLPAFELWVCYNALSNAACLHETEDGGCSMHQYTHDLTSGTYVIRHRLCERSSGSVVQEGMPPVCCKCYSLSNDRGIVRMITRFYLKHTAAHLLQAKLFRESQVEALLQEVRGSTMYQQACEKEFDTMFKLDLRALQQYVRTQFMSVPKNKWSRSLRDLIHAVVEPCLSVAVHSWSSAIACRAETLAAKLSSRTLASVDDLNLKLGSQVACGALNEHPVVQGVLIAAVEMSLRKARGSTTMRQLQVSDVEKALMIEAGVCISLAANNNHLLREFGLAWTAPKLPLSNMQGHGLPDPFLAVASPEVLQKNALLIDGLLPPRGHCRRLTMALDKTYLLKGLDIVQVRQGRGYVGTCFQLSSLASGSSSSSGAVGSEEQQQAADASGFLPLAASAASQEASQATEGQQAWEQAGQATTVHPMTYDAANLHYAMEMLECLVWDPAVPRIPRYSLCSLRDT